MESQRVPEKSKQKLLFFEHIKNISMVLVPETNSWTKQSHTQRLHFIKHE